MLENLPFLSHTEEPSEGLQNRTRTDAASRLLRQTTGERASLKDQAECRKFFPGFLRVSVQDGVKSKP